MIRTLRAIGAAIVLTTGAQAAAPTVESVVPGVGQRGTQFDLTLFGVRLDKPEEMMFYGPGLTCTKLAAKGENEVKVTLSADKECRLGEYPFRLRTTGGASEVRIVRITPFPVLAEKEPNDTRQTAQLVPMNVSIAGTIEAAGFDHYAVKLKKGERLSAEVEGVRLGGALTDTVLTVFGPDEKQLMSVDDTPLFRQDPFITLRAPADGVYTVQVRDTNFGGGDRNHYVLHVGSFPRPAAVFPPGGQAGTELAVKLFDDASGDISESIQLPAAGVPFEYYPKVGEMAAPTPNPFRVSAFPNVNEVEPNDSPQQPGAAVAWPVAFNGIINQAGDIDHFRFRAAKGDVIDVNAFAFRVGSPLDSVVAVLDARGEALAANDDDETHDSHVRVHIPDDGDYFVRVSDKRKQGGPRFIYRVELDKPKAGLAIFLPDQVRKAQTRNAITIPRGNRVVAFLAVRRDGCAGAVSTKLASLPDGVKVDVPTIPASEYYVPVVFEASHDAPVGGKFVQFTGTCGDGPQAPVGRFSQSVTLIDGPGDLAIQSVKLDKLAVVVVDPSPFSVEVVPPRAPLVPDGTLDIKVHVQREKDCTEALDVFFPSLPPGVEAPTSVPIPADKSEAVVTLVAHPAAAVGDWRLIAEVKPARAARTRDPLAAALPAATGAGRRRRATDSSIPVSSQAINLKVADSVVKGHFAPVAGEQGKTIKVVCDIDAQTPLPANLNAKLDGLPPRAVSSPRDIEGDAKRVEFQVAIDPTTPLGEHKSLVCELTGSVDGNKVVYRVGRGGSLRVDAVGAVKTDKEGKPLSPLEALRQSEKKNN